MTAQLRKLVAGVAAMNEMDPVIPYAAALGASADLPLDLIHVFDVSDPFVQEYLRASIFPGDPLQKYCEGLQARLEGQVGGLAGRGEVHCRAVPGSPSEILREEASDAQNLLLVGPTRRGRPSAAFLGTTAQRVLHGTGSPVLVLRSEIPAQPRVLYAVDLVSPEARVMIGRAATIIGQLWKSGPARTRIVTAVRLEVELELGLPILQQNVFEAAEAGMERFVQELPNPGTFETCVRMGSPPQEVVVAAEEWAADLIVVGTQARAGLARAVLGSVAEGIVRNASCSVLVIPPPDDNQS